MRLKEPFNGLKKAQGHVLFHVAMLISSFYMHMGVLEESKVKVQPAGTDSLETI